MDCGLADWIHPKIALDRELMDDCGVMSAMTATTSGRAKFDFQAETCFLQVRQSGGHGNTFFTHGARTAVEEREVSEKRMTTAFLGWQLKNTAAFVNLSPGTVSRRTHLALPLELTGETT